VIRFGAVLKYDNGLFPIFYRADVIAIDAETAALIFAFCHDLTGFDLVILDKPIEINKTIEFN
tara:strand:+ start:1298 stop:1486 length:189 start_codon:yes stop_codon:yes gene_type:complete